MKNNAKFLLYATVGVITIILFAVGVTYAYFEIKSNNEAGIDVTTSTTTQTKVEYVAGDSIALENAEPGATDELIFSIKLTASNKTTDTVNYGINWAISKNTFAYESAYPNDAQLVYSLYSSSDKSTWNPVVTSKDCTTWNGTKTIASNQQLTASANTTKTIYYKFVLEYKSYNYNQASNMSKLLNGTIKVTGLK